MKTKQHCLIILSAAVIVSCGRQRPSSNEVTAFAEVDQTDTAQYVISVPPGSSDDFHLKTDNDLRKWVRTNKVQIEKSFWHKKTDGKKSGGHAFRLALTPDQLSALQKAFPASFIGPETTFDCPGAGEPPNDGGIGVRTSGAAATWAVSSVVGSGVTLEKDSPSSPHTPVLYVVDSGVQPMAAKTGGTHGNFSIHPQFNSTRIKFRNGRVPTSVGTWPAPGATSPWNAVDDIISYPVAPYNAGVTSANFLDPNMDAIIHGTKVVSTAIGCASADALGVLSYLGGANQVSVEVEPIRIYPASGSPTSLQVADGIYEAVDAHLSRPFITYNGTQYPPRSVLLLASRSTSGFAVNVEVALLYAYQQGMIVVCAGGDSNTTYTTNCEAPDALWYQPNGQLPSAQPTSPSRFDLEMADQLPTCWPSPQDPQGYPIPRPTAVNNADRCYAILVGGNNLVYNAGNPPVAENSWSNPISGVYYSTRGPDIDIVVPTNAVPCATNSLNTYTNGIITTNGTSLSVGFIAGLAVAYLDHNTPDKTPKNFREWLLPLLKQPDTKTPYQATAATLAGWTKTGITDDHKSWYLIEPFKTYSSGWVPKAKVTSTTEW